MSQKVEMKASLIVEDMLMDTDSTEIPIELQNMDQICFVAPNKAHSSIVHPDIVPQIIGYKNL